MAERVISLLTGENEELASDDLVFAVIEELFGSHSRQRRARIADSFEIINER